MNMTVSPSQPTVSFYFQLNAQMTDVTIEANTWVTCNQWKASGMADPDLELYSASQQSGSQQLLASNDDGNMTPQNCFAAVLSWSLTAGLYKVIVGASDTCSYGQFELHLSAATTT